jgi:predicted TPR repeat methyltransferase
MTPETSSETAGKRLLEEARAATARRDWETAATLFHELALASPKAAAHWHNLSLARLRGGLTPDRASARRAVLLAPDLPGYLNNLLAQEAGRPPARMIAWLLILAPDHARARADQAFAYLSQGSVDAALGAAQRAQIAAPALPEGIARAAQALVAETRGEKARDLYRRYITLDPQDSLGVGRDLARVGAIETAQAMTPAFVAGVFDGYASGFDAHLTGKLRYVGPKVLAGMLRGLSLEPVERAVDLGCGSGLSGLELRPLAGLLIGVDLSARMLELARDRAIYDEIHHSEIVTWLTSDKGGYGLAMAADVTSYLGDLGPFFSAVAGALVPGGRLALTVHEQEHGDFGIVVGETYSHSEAYVRRVATTAGLRIERIERGAMRDEKKLPLPTLFLVLRKT